MTAAAAPGARRSLLLFAAGAVIGLGLAGYALFTAKGTAAGGLPPEDMALVNGRPILRTDFVTQIQLETGMDFAQTGPADRQKVLDEMIDEELLVQRGLEVDLAASDPDVRAALVAGVNLQVDADVLAQQPSEAELQAWFAAHRDRYATDGTMRLLDLVATADQAEAAAAALRQGLAVPEAKARFGLTDTHRIDAEDNFDFGVKAKLGETLYKAAAALKAGEVSAPVALPDGRHILVMVKRVPPVERSFAEARDTVFQDLRRDAQARVERANLNYLKSKAEIRVAEGYRP